MAKPTHQHRRPFATLMLIMVVWQCLFVAVEAGERFNALAELDGHHPLTHLTDSHPPCPEAQCVAHNRSPTEAHSPAHDTCDRCCACQGHGAHLSLHPKVFALRITSATHHQVTDPQTFCSIHPTTLYRPPIA